MINKSNVVLVKCHSSMSMTDFLGRWEVRDGNPLFILGPLPMAMRNGSLLILENAHMLCGSVTRILADILARKSLVIPESAEVVIAHNRFFSVTSLASARQSSICY